MIPYFNLALTSLNTAMGLGKTLLDIRDFAKAQETLIDFNKAIIDAQSQIMMAQNEQSALKQQIDELKQECVRLKDWSSERQKYSRKEIAPGAFAYIENDFVGRLQNAHKLCCNCFDQQKKSTLQQNDVIGTRYSALSCHNGCPELKFRYYNDDIA
jgi:hypothetical protein